MFNRTWQSHTPGYDRRFSGQIYSRTRFLKLLLQWVTNELTCHGYSQITLNIRLHTWSVLLMPVLNEKEKENFIVWTTVQGPSLPPLPSMPLSFTVMFPHSPSIKSLIHHPHTIHCKLRMIVHNKRKWWSALIPAFSSFIWPVYTTWKIKKLYFKDKNKTKK